MYNDECGIGGNAPSSSFTFTAPATVSARGPKASDAALDKNRSPTSTYRKLWAVWGRSPQLANFSREAPNSASITLKPVRMTEPHYGRLISYYTAHWNLGNSFEDKSCVYCFDIRVNYIESSNPFLHTKQLAHSAMLAWGWCISP